MNFNFLSKLHQKTVNLVNSNLSPAIISFEKASSYNEIENGMFSLIPTDWGYLPLLKVFRLNPNQPDNFAIESCILLHEFGHFLSWKNKLTNFSYKFENHSRSILKEEFTAWKLAFVTLFKLDVSIFHKLFMFIYMIGVGVSSYNYYLGNHLVKAIKGL